MNKQKLFLEDELVKAQTKINYLEESLNEICEDGTEEHNAAVILRSELAQSRLEIDEWKRVARQLYGVALHLQVVANSGNNVVVVGPGLYSESVDAIAEYENLQND